MIHLGHIKYYDILVIVQKYLNKDNQGQARPYQKIRYVMCPLPICDLFDTVTFSLLFLFFRYSKLKSEIGVIFLWSLYYFSK